MGVSLPPVRKMRTKTPVTANASMSAGVRKPFADSSFAPTAFEEPLDIYGREGTNE